MGRCSFKSAEYIYSEGLYNLEIQMSSNKKYTEVFESQETIANNLANFIVNNTEKSEHNANKNLNSISQLEPNNKTQTLLILQKAQILRLTQCLNDYKCKLRQLSGENLDRKSYQTQIAQLFESNNKNRSEIEKLNNSIKSLVSSNEKYRKQLSIANQKVFQFEQNKRQVNEKYQIMKFQYDIMSQDFQNYKKQNQQNFQRLHKQLMFHKNYTDNLKANSEDLMKRVNSIPTYENKIFELEKTISFYKAQSEKLKEQITRGKQNISNVERNHLQLYQKNDKTEKQYDQMKKLHAQLQAKLSNFVNQAIKDEQNQRIEKQSKTNTKESKKLMSLQEQIKTLKLRNQKILITSKALTDINNKLKDQKKLLQTQINSLKRVLSDYQKKINDELNKNSILNYELNKQQGQLRKQLTEKQQRIQSLTKQNQKMMEQIKGFNKMITNKIKQSQYLKRKLIQVQNDLRQQFESNFQEQKKSHHYQMIQIQKKMSLNVPQNIQGSKNLKQFEDQNNQIKLQIHGAQDDSALTQIKSLQAQIQDHKRQIEKLTQQRNQVATLLENKTRQNQKLKQKFFSLEEDYRDQLNESVQKMKLSYLDKIKQLQTKLRAQHQDHKLRSSPEELDSIKELTNQRDKLSKEVIQLKSLLKQSDLKFIETWKQIQKLHEILETNQLKYKTKIEVYFRNNLNLQQNLNRTNRILANKQIQFEEGIRLLKDLEEANAENINLFSKLQSQFISIQLLTAELKQERDLLLKKNSSLIKGIQHLNHQMKMIHESAQKISLFFTKDSNIHQTLQKHYSTVQQIFNSIQKLKEDQQKAHRLQTHSNL